MTRPAIAIRADASGQIGSGHIMRCLTLANELARRGARVLFICREITPALKGMILAAGHELSMLSEEHDTTAARENDDDIAHARWLSASWAADARQTANVLRDYGGVQWLIVDHYALDYRWENAVRDGAVQQLMAIDDLADRKHACDLLLDVTLDRKERDYADLVPDRARLFLGPRYALLRRQFARLRHSAIARRNTESSVRRILISFGGGHHGGKITAKALEAIRETAAPGILADAALGGASPRKLGLDALARNMPQKVRFHDFSADMARLAHDADLALGAGGMSAWERCCLGLPTLLTVLAENQKQGAAALERAGAAVIFTPGNLKQLLAQALASTTWRRNMAARAMRIVQGEGAWLMAGHLLPETLRNGVSLSLTPLDMTHAGLLLNWQREPGARRFSRNPLPPSQNDHMAWMRNTLTDPSRHCWIMEIGAKPAGVIRLDFDANQKAEISILVSAAFRGSGAGRAALKMAGDFFSWTEITAAVHAENIASLRLFKGAGYQETSHQPDKDGFLRLVRKGADASETGENE